jgi:molecular chaperone DnaJ
LKDLYKIMGLTKAASADEIESQYRKLAREYHPDRNVGDKSAEDKFKELTNAYEVLSNSEKKFRYDSSRESPRSRKPFSSPMDDFFEGFFGDRAANSNLHIYTATQISLFDAYQGGKIVISFCRHKFCKKCKGLGVVTKPCPHCEGSGYKMIFGESHTIKTSCMGCEGKGNVVKKSCSCEQGVLEKDNIDYEFSYFPGIEDGMRFMIPEMGNEDADGKFGDLHVTVRVSHDEIYKRFPGGNLMIEVPVGYAQLVIGDSVELKTVGDEQLRLKIPAGTQPGAKFKLAKMGMPIFNNSNGIYQRGDLLVQLKLEVPSEIDEDFRSLVEELADMERSKPGPLREAFVQKMGGKNAGK